MNWLADVASAAVRSPLVVLLGAFLATFVLTRAVTCLIRSGRGVFSDLAVGTLHLHHMVWGAGLVLVSGTFEFAFTPGRPWALLPAAGFGVGAALVLDEFALMLYLRDVYWSEEGRRSIDAVIMAIIALGMLAVPLTAARHARPPASRPIIVVVVVAYIGLMAVCLLKGKIFSGVLGLVLPPALLFAAVRLARPGSAWARVAYRNDRAKRARAAVRYRPSSAHERLRHRVLELVGGTIPQLVYSGLPDPGESEPHHR